MQNSNPSIKSEQNPQVADSVTVQGTFVNRAADFYAETSKQLVSCCGHEVGTPDYHSALALLDSKLQLGMPEVDRRAFSLMLTSLSNSHRFGGEIHIDPVQGENSAAHSCHAMILGHEIFRRAGLLAPDQFTEEVSSLHRAIVTGCLIHDMGEILGEITSLAQRAADSSLKELPDTEREIFRLALTEAYRVATTDPSDPSAFYSFIQELRHEAQLSRKGIAGACPVQLDDSLARHAKAQDAQPLSAEGQARVDEFLRLYDMAEMKSKEHSPAALFIGNAVKVVEHLQGLRHFMRFARTESHDRRVHLFSPETHLGNSPYASRPTPASDVISMRYMSSPRLIQNARYIEKELPALFIHASTNTELALAHSLRDAAYQCQIEWYSIGRPFIHRQAEKENPPVSLLQKQYMAAESHAEKSALSADIERLLRIQLNKDRELFLRQSTPEVSPHSVTPALLPYESRPRIIQLYAEALRVSYVPTAPTPLLLLPEVPEELRGCMRKSTPNKGALPSTSPSSPDSFEGATLPPV